MLSLCPTKTCGLLFIMVFLFINVAVADEEEFIFISPDVIQMIEQARTYAARGDYQSLKLMRKQAVKPLKKIADQAQQSGSYGKASYIYKELYDLHAKLYGKYDRRAILYLQRLANTWQLAGKPARQIKILNELLNYYEKNFGPSSHDVEQTIKSLAQAYEAQRSYAKSAQMYERLLEKYRKNGWTEGRQYKSIQQRIADLYLQQGEFRKAKPYIERSGDIKPGETITITAGNFNKLLNYAQTLAVSGKYAEAEEIFYKVIDFSEKNPAINPFGSDMYYAFLGDLYHQLGAYQKALDYKEKGYKAAAHYFGNTSVMSAYMLTNLAETKIALKRYEQALNDMLVVDIILGNQIQKKNQLYIDENFSMPTLALAYARVGQYDKAEQIFTRTLDVLSEKYSPRHILVTYGKSNLVEVYYLENKLDKAYKLAIETLNLSASNNSPLLLSRIYFLLGKIRHKQSAEAEAIFYAKQGVNYLQSLRTGLINTEKSLQKSFVDSQQENYEMLAGWLIDAGRLSEAEQVLAMLKEEEYFNFIRRSQNADPKLTRAELNNTEAQQREYMKKSAGLIIKYSNKLNEMKKDESELLSEQDKEKIQNYERLLKAAEENFTQTLADIRSVFARQKVSADIQLNQDAQQLLVKLGKNVALVHFLPLDNDLRILLTTSEIKIAKKVKVSHKQLNRAINNYKQLINRPDKPLKDIQTYSNELYEWLIQPIAKELEQLHINTVMFYKNGVLRYIPLSTLYDGKRYLIEKFAVSNYTAAAKESFARHLRKHWQVAAMGVSKQYGEFAPLRMVPFELDSIVKQDTSDPDGIFSGQVYINEDFNAQHYKSALAGDFNVNHIATHYKFMPGTESDSFLLLGDGSHLSLATLRTDHYDFKKIDLLTLSACETAISDVTSDGREVEGLATLVQKQGAKGVMATLWPVADCSTGAFMQEFYEQRKKGLSKAEALRQSQLAFLYNRIPPLRIITSDPSKGCQPASQIGKNPYKHPYFWAPFILMGNWQ